MVTIAHKNTVRDPNDCSMWIMGRLGDSEGRGQDEELTPREVQSVSHLNMAHLAAGPYHAALVSGLGDVYTWGANFFGQLGRDVELGSHKGKNQLATRFEEMGLGLIVDSLDISGRFVDPTNTSVTSPTPRPRVLRALSIIKAYCGNRAHLVSCGGAHTVVVCAEGIALAFGCNLKGQLGVQQPEASLPPASRGQATLGGNVQYSRLWSLPSELHLPNVFVVSASCGGMHTLLLSKEGKVFSFGDGANGRLGHGNCRNYSLPQPIASLESKRITFIAAGWTHSMAIDDDGKLFTWGCGNAGRLGHGNVLDVWRPRFVDRLYRIRMKAMMASGSYDHSAVCCENGTVWTWGLGEHGQLGVGSTESHLEPVLVKSMADANLHIVEVSCGGAHTAAVTNDGTLLTWGRGDWGQLGHGNRSSILCAKVVSALQGKIVKQVSCGWGVTLVQASLAPGRTLDEGEELERSSVSFSLSEDKEISPSQPLSDSSHSESREKLDLVSELQMMHASGLVTCDGEHMESLPPSVAKNIPIFYHRENSSETPGMMNATIDLVKVREGVRFYRVLVRYAALSWSIERRYNQFRMFHIRLQRSFRGFVNADVPFLPPRIFSLKFNKTASFSDVVERRLQDLQAYLDQLMAIPGVTVLPCFRAFFEMNNLRYNNRPISLDMLHKPDPSQKSMLEKIASQAPGNFFSSLFGENTPRNSVKTGVEVRVDHIFHPDLIRYFTTPSKTANVMMETTHDRNGESEGDERSRQVYQRSVKIDSYARDVLPRASFLSPRAQFDSREEERDEIDAVCFPRPRDYQQPHPRHSEGIKGHASEASGSHPSSFSSPDRPAHGASQDDLPRRPDPSLWRGCAYWLHEMLPQWEQTGGDVSKSPRKRQALALLVHDGISAFARSYIWPLSIGNNLNLNRDLYSILKLKARTLRKEGGIFLGREDSAKLVQTDLSRTLSHLGLFDPSGPFYDELRDVLEAYCYYRPDVGYVQGMSFQAAIFVLHCNDDFAAFTCLANLISRPFFQCFYRNNSNSLLQRMQIFDRIFQFNLHDLYKFFDSLEIRSDLYVSLWFVTLFAKQLPVPLCARVWDIYLVQGEIFLYRVAVGMLKLLSPSLKAKESDDVLKILLGNIADELPSEQKVLAAIEQIRIPKDADLQLQKLIVQEAVQEFKSDQAGS